MVADDTDWLVIVDLGAVIALAANVHVCLRIVIDRGTYGCEEHSRSGTI